MIDIYNIGEKEKNEIGRIVKLLLQNNSILKGTRDKRGNLSDNTDYDLCNQYFEDVSAYLNLMGITLRHDAEHEIFYVVKADGNNSPFISKGRNELPMEYSFILFAIKHFYDDNWNDPSATIRDVLDWCGNDTPFITKEVGDAKLKKILSFFKSKNIIQYAYDVNQLIRDNEKFYITPIISLYVTPELNKRFYDALKEIEEGQLKEIDEYGEDEED